MKTISVLKDMAYDPFQDVNHWDTWWGRNHWSSWQTTSSNRESVDGAASAETVPAGEVTLLRGGHSLVCRACQLV